MLKLRSGQDVDKGVPRKRQTQERNNKRMVSEHRTFKIRPNT